MSTAAVPAKAERIVSPALLFLLSCAWIVVALAGGRLAGTLSSALLYDTSRQLVTALLLLCGFYLMARFGIRDLRPLSSVGFVRRPGVATEFGIGCALGWGISLLLILPAVLSRNVTLTPDFSAPAFQHTFVAIALLVGWALLLQLVVSGLPVRLLVRSTGQTWAVFAVLGVAFCLTLSSTAGQGRGVLFTLLAAGIFLSAFLRTRAIWLPLGLQLSWTISLQVLFGAASPYTTVPGGLVRNVTGGPVWLTGGPFGPETSTVGILVLVIALVVLRRVTRTYAWHYTYQPVTAAGYPVDVPPPAEHAREEQRVAQAVPLIQIGGVAAAPKIPPSQLP